MAFDNTSNPSPQCKSWPEVVACRRQSKTSLFLSGKKLDDMLTFTNGIVDPGLFEQEQINHLELCESALSYLDDDIGKLTNLLNLVIRNNALEEIPDTIGNLDKLKLLDFSRNKLISPPDSMFSLSNLYTLNLSSNGIEQLHSLVGLTNLHEIMLTSNKLTALPDGLASLEHLHTVRADHNLLEDLPDDLNELMQLKELNLLDNKLKGLPPSLAGCAKLKFLDVRENPFSDRKLLKLSQVDQTVPKPFIKFLQPLYEKSKSSKGKNRKKKGATKQVGTNSDGSDVDELVDSLKVLRFTGAASSQGEVKVAPTVSEVRPYIVCCIIRNVNFLQTPTLFRQFIAVQTRLHEGVCEKRLAATIATHDLGLLKFPLVYEATNPRRAMLIPLGNHKETSAADFMLKLRKEADDFRKQKKRNNVTGIHKYLDMLKDQRLYPVLKDREEQIISLPPLTNCDGTKITDGTTDVFVEVTSSRSWVICKQVIQELVLESKRIGISADPKELLLEQVRVVDLEGSPLTVYPSKADLTEVPFTVIRD